MNLREPTTFLEQCQGERRTSSFVVFQWKQEHMLENSKNKLKKKNLDMICANNLKVEGAGFGTDTNVVTLITENESRQLPIMSKEQVANEILTEINNRI